MTSQPFIAYHRDFIQDPRLLYAFARMVSTADHRYARFVIVSHNGKLAAHDPNDGC